MRWDVLTISCGACKEALLLFSLLQISALRISGFRPIMAGGAISPRNTLRCRRLHLLKLLRGKQILCLFSIGGKLTQMRLYKEIGILQVSLLWLKNCLCLDRVKCARRGGLRFTLSGSSHFYQVLITNVGLDGEVVAVKVKGSKTGWIPMARNWGQNWQSNINLKGQPLSFEVTSSTGRTLTSYNVAPAEWRFGQTFEGKQFWYGNVLQSSKSRFWNKGYQGKLSRKSCRWVSWVLNLHLSQEDEVLVKKKRGSCRTKLKSLEHEVPVLSLFIYKMILK